MSATCTHHLPILNKQYLDMKLNIGCDKEEGGGGVVNDALNSFYLRLFGLGHMDSRFS